MRQFRARLDARIAEIANRQHGVVSVAQLQAVGLDHSAVKRRVQAGRLHRLHRGVYAVGYRCVSQEGAWMAAVLAAGRDAVLSHRSAAMLWDLLPVRAGVIETTVRGYGGRKQRPGIRVHRSASLAKGHVTRRRGIPTTTPARTIADLRGKIAAHELRRALRQAAVLGLVTGSDEVDNRTRSELEFVFLELCKAHELPSPAVNVRIGPFVVDFVWATKKLIVETDGYRYHRGRTAFEIDRERDLKLRALGYDVIRLTYRQVVDRPRETASAIKAALGSWRETRT